ncbi:hypothetical protein MTR67_048082 [Solanum verrucosum]|uniref:Uncharacterized protein n=1 Tax=Solanum verrucosum TaxID=315347 RepID=A0AAF0UXT0_SOLVR|nr:hypothetical protein MTR67_048082 [Solanum verrucosum]
MRLTASHPRAHERGSPLGQVLEAVHDHHHEPWFHSRPVKGSMKGPMAQIWAEDFTEVFLDDFSIVGKTFEEFGDAVEKVKDRKGYEIQVVDHFSRSEADARMAEKKYIDDPFTNES